MKVVKYIAQITSALLYTGLFIGIVNLLIVFPIAWYLSLSTFWKVVIFLFGTTTIISVISVVVSLSTLPYRWICKENIVSALISEAYLLCRLITLWIGTWKVNYGGDWLSMLVCIFVSIVLLYAIGYMSITIYYSYKNEN